MTMLLVNLPVDRSGAREGVLHGDRLPHQRWPSTDHNAACVFVEEDHSALMLLTREFFQTFSDLPIGDPAVSPVGGDRRLPRHPGGGRARPSRRASPRAAESRIAATDYGFMYQRQLNDPDGNILEFGYMDPVAAAQGPEAFANQQA